MRVLLVASSFQSVGGAERVANDWAQGLSEMGHEVRQLSLVDLGSRARRWSRSVTIVREIRRAARVHRADVALSVATYANLMTLRACRKRCPVIISEHSIPSVLLMQEGWRGRIKLRAARRSYPTASALLGVSTAVITDLISCFSADPDRVFRLPNPVACPEGVLNPGDGPLGQGDLVFVGRFVRQKRPELVIALAVALKERGTPRRVVMIGDGPLLGPCRTAALAADVDVVFTGWSDNWVTHCNPRSLLVLPSEVEGFGNVLVEASLHGFPVVAITQSLGVVDAVVEGVTGALSRSSRVSDLVEAVDRASALARSSSFDDIRQALSQRHASAAVTAELVLLLEAARSGSWGPKP